MDLGLTLSASVKSGFRSSVSSPSPVMAATRRSSRSKTPPKNRSSGSGASRAPRTPASAPTAPAPTRADRLNRDASALLQELRTLGAPSEAAPWDEVNWQHLSELRTQLSALIDERHPEPPTPEPQIAIRKKVVPRLLLFLLLAVTLGTVVAGSGDKSDASSHSAVRHGSSLAVWAQRASAFAAAAHEAMSLTLRKLGSALASMPLQLTLPPALLGAAAILPRLAASAGVTERWQWLLGVLLLLGAMQFATQAEHAAAHGSHGGDRGGSTLRRQQFSDAVADATGGPANGAAALEQWAAAWQRGGEEGGEANGAAVLLLFGSRGGKRAAAAADAARDVLLASPPGNAPHPPSTHPCPILDPHIPAPSYCHQPRCIPSLPSTAVWQESSSSRQRSIALLAAAPTSSSATSPPPPPALEGA